MSYLFSVFQEINFESIPRNITRTIVFTLIITYAGYVNQTEILGNYDILLEKPYDMHKNDTGYDKRLYKKENYRTGHH
jgi:hypothetical protein